MVAAMACFALEDVLLKQMSVTLPVGQVLAMTGVGGALVFSFIARVAGRPVLSRAALLRPVMLRNLTEALGSTAFVTALALTTLSGASAILQATPLAMTLGASLYFGETVRWRRWTAIVVGFIGVLLIIQPGMASFSPASLFAVVAVLMLAVRDLCGRAVPPSVSSVQLAAWGFASLVPAGLAGGIGLCGGGCGALGAAIWLIEMDSRQEGNAKSDFKNPRALAAVEKFMKCTDYEFECAEIVGRKFENVEEHAAYVREGGCSEIIEALATA